MRAQAWGWLVAGVLAAGMNAWYHDGGFRWAHSVAEKVEHGTAAVVALASGHADEFFVQARMMTVADQPSRCRLSAQLARFQAMSDRQQAQLDRFQADRERLAATMEAQAERMQVRMLAMNPMRSQCQRVIVRVPRVPVMRIPQLAPLPSAPMQVSVFGREPI